MFFARRAFKVRLGKTRLVSISTTIKAPMTQALRPRIATTVPRDQTRLGGGRIVQVIVAVARRAEDVKAEKPLQAAATLEASPQEVGAPQKKSNHHQRQPDQVAGRSEGCGRYS